MYHTLIIVGNLGKDPGMRYTPSGQAVCKFSVASTRQYSNGAGETIKETVWFSISSWGKQAEVCNQYLKKGSKVLVEGRLIPDRETGAPRVWTRQDGTAGATFEVNAQTVRFLSPAQGGSMTETAQELGGNESTTEEDIPF